MLVTGVCVCVCFFAHFLLNLSSLKLFVATLVNSSDLFDKCNSQRFQFFRKQTKKTDHERTHEIEETKSASSQHSFFSIDVKSLLRRL